MKGSEFFTLLLINLQVKAKNSVEFIRTAFKYYTYLPFAKCDLYLLSCYWMKSPFKISKEFLEKKGEEEVFAYGETPLTTLEKIAERCKIQPSDTVIELGCGRGRACFWLHFFKGCRVIGIDFVPEFIQKAQKTQQKFQFSGVEFLLQDMLKVDLSSATVIYLYGTCLKVAEIEALLRKFKQLPRGVKIITVSFSLKEYDPHCPFEVVKCFPAKFTWGEGDVYVQM